jgi:hypothetical protein
LLLKQILGLLSSADPALETIANPADRAGCRIRAVAGRVKADLIKAGRSPGDRERYLRYKSLQFSTVIPEASSA